MALTALDADPSASTGAAADSPCDETNRARPETRPEQARPANGGDST